MWGQTPSRQTGRPKAQKVLNERQSLFRHSRFHSCAPLWHKPRTCSERGGKGGEERKAQKEREGERNGKRKESTHVVAHPLSFLRLFFLSLPPLPLSLSHPSPTLLALLQRMWRIHRLHIVHFFLPLRSSQVADVFPSRQPFHLALSPIAAHSLFPCSRHKHPVHGLSFSYGPSPSGRVERNAKREEETLRKRREKAQTLSYPLGLWARREQRRAGRENLRRTGRSERQRGRGARQERGKERSEAARKVKPLKRPAAL